MTCNRKGLQFQPASCNSSACDLNRLLSLSAVVQAGSSASPSPPSPHFSFSAAFGSSAHIEQPLRFWRSWRRRLQPRSVPFRQIEPGDQQLIDIQKQEMIGTVWNCMELLVFDDFWNHFSHFSETILLVVVPQELWDIITNREESLRQTWQDAKIPVGPKVPIQR